MSSHFQLLLLSKKYNSVVACYSINCAYRISSNLSGDSRKLLFYLLIKTKKKFSAKCRFCPRCWLQLKQAANSSENHLRGRLFPPPVVIQNMELLQIVAKYKACESQRTLWQSSQVCLCSRIKTIYRPNKSFPQQIYSKCIENYSQQLVIMK